MMRKNELPKYVDILSHRYDIEFAKFDNDNIGFIQDRDSIIQLSDELAPETLKYVLWHEIFHGVDFAVGAELSEAHVTALANATLDVMRRNRSIIEFIIN